MNKLYFKNNPKIYEYLKMNSYLYKDLNRETMDINTFIKLMKTKYHERTSDKVSSFIDNIDLINSLLDVLK